MEAPRLSMVDLEEISGGTDQSTSRAFRRYLFFATQPRPIFSSRGRDHPLGRVTELGKNFAGTAIPTRESAQVGPLGVRKYSIYEGVIILEIRQRKCS